MLWRRLAEILGVILVSGYVTGVLAETASPYAKKQCTPNYSAIRSCDELKSDKQRYQRCIQENENALCIKRSIVSEPRPPVESCKRELKEVTKQCAQGVYGRMSQCLDEHYSSACREQVATGARRRANAACNKDVRSAAKECGTIVIKRIHQCKQEHISPACWEQVAEIVDQGRKRQLCENAKSALCNNRSSGQPLRDCILQHQAELKAVCGGSLEKVFN